MNWGQAKNLLRLATSRRIASPDEDAAESRTVDSPNGKNAKHAPRDASELRETNGHAPRRVEVEPPTASAVTRRAASLCVASGKGGTGKSVVTASLAALLGRRGRTLIVDADMGVGNAHILQGVSPEHSLVDVAEGRMGVVDVVQQCRDGVDLLCAGSGVSRMAGLSSYEMHLIASGIQRLESQYDHVVVDSAAGISEQTVAFAAACDTTLLVTTPDLTAITDAYAFLKVLYARDSAADVLVVVNRVEDEEEGRRAADRIASVSDRFLGRTPSWVGTLHDDSAVRAAGNHRAPVVLYDEKATVSDDLRRLGARVHLELVRVEEERGAPAGVGTRLVAECGFSSRF